MCACTTNKYAVFLYVENTFFMYRTIGIYNKISTTGMNLCDTISVIIKAALRIVGLVTVLV